MVESKSLPIVEEVSFQSVEKFLLKNIEGK